jgi:hypothetical protein
MNIIFLQVAFVLFLVCSPALYFLYKAVTNGETRPDSDLARIRYIKEIETIESMNGKTND